jgi:hypothetical protein
MSKKIEILIDEDDISTLKLLHSEVVKSCLEFTPMRTKDMILLKVLNQIIESALGVAKNDTNRGS